MNKQIDVFKDYSNALFDYQKPILNEIQKHDKVLLKAPMDFGKTYIACSYVSKLLNEEKIKNVTFAIQNYQMRSKIISDLKATGMDNAVIVCPEGRDRAFGSHKRKRVTSLKINTNDLKGKVIDVEYAKKNWPSYNPYYVLLYLQRFADVIIAQHSLVNTNKKIRKTDLLIVDDADLMNRDIVFSIAKYKVFQEHLQAIEESITEAKELRAKLQRYKDKLPLLNAMMDTLFQYLPENPEQLETLFISERQERMKQTETNPLFELWIRGKTEHEIADEFNRRKRSDITIGIKQASNPTKLNSLLSEFKDTLQRYTDALEDKISNEISYAITLHIDHRIEDFFNALMEPKFHVKRDQTDRNWGTLEINVSNGSNFMDVVNGYNKVLWLSATANPEELKGFSLVESKFDPHSDHKIIHTISKEMIPDVLAKLKNHNVFVVTNSSKGAEEFRNQYGGAILNSQTYDTIVRNAKNSKGNLTIGYVNGIGSRGLDDLAQLYDAVIVYSWIYRSVIQRDGKFYDETAIANNLRDGQQLIGRIMRGSSEHILFLIQDESEIGAKLQEYISNENPDWKHIDNLDEVIAKIPERTVKEERKTILRKETRILKDGSKELIYRAKATDDKIESAPNQLEI